MATENWTTRQWCPQCQENVKVYWTRIYQKNARGELIIDETTGRDAANHEFDG